MRGDSEGPMAEVGPRMVQMILGQPLLIVVQIGQIISGAGKPGKISFCPAELVFGTDQPLGIIQKKGTNHGHASCPVNSRLTMDQDGCGVLVIQDAQEPA